MMRVSRLDHVLGVCLLSSVHVDGSDRIGFVPQRRVAIITTVSVNLVCRQLHEERDPSSALRVAAEAVHEQRRDVHALGFAGARLAFSRKRDSRAVDDSSELPVGGGIGSRGKRLLETGACGEVADRRCEAWVAEAMRRLCRGLQDGDLWRFFLIPLQRNAVQSHSEGKVEKGSWGEKGWMKGSDIFMDAKKDTLCSYFA